MKPHESILFVSWFSKCNGACLGWVFLIAACGHRGGSHDSSGSSANTTASASGDPLDAVDRAKVLLQSPAQGASRIAEADRLLRGACEAGDVNGCTGAAEVHFDFSSDKDLVPFADSLEPGCKANDALSCALLGRAKQERKDMAGARAAFARACDLSSGMGCFFLALADGPSATSDDRLARSVGLAEAECNNGEKVGCVTAGNAFDYGRAVPVDSKRAFALYKKGCDLGLASACGEQCSIMSDGRGDGSRADGVALCRRSCDEGSMIGCNNLGVALELGQGVASDYVRSTAAYQQACDAGSVAGCGNLCIAIATGRGVYSDAPRGLALCESNCAAGGAHGCRNAGILYARGQGAAQDRKKAEKYMERSCDLKAAKGCADFAYALREGWDGKKDPVRGLTQARWSCDRGVGWGCHVGADILRSGMGVPKDLTGGAELYLRGCERGDAPSCKEAADLFDHGVTIAGAPTPEKLRALGCERGDKAACPPR